MTAYFNIIVVVFFGFILGCSPKEKVENKESSDTNPNIILIISDDQGWTDYSFLGHEHIKTPQIDRLAQEGLTFTRGWTTAPLCRPALASIATGLFPYQHKVLGNDPVFSLEGSRKYGVEWLEERKKQNEPYVSGFEKIPTIADLLKSEGYISLQTGKWWEGHYSVGGFDQGMTHGDPQRKGRHGDEGLKIGREGLEVIYKFIDSAQSINKPFYIWYAPFLPHNPHNPPDSLINKYISDAPSEAVANYWATCEWFDITCGQLVDYVEDKKLRENTLFIYVTDNGWIQSPDRPNRYAPRSKREPYEMGVRTPIIFNWKGAIDAKMDTETPVSSIDIATTILSICNMEPTNQMQGINVLDIQSLEQRDAVFAETYAHDFTNVDSSLFYRIVVDMPYKLILPDDNNLPDKRPELYDIVDDPHETKDLSASHRDIVKNLSGKIESWWNPDDK